MEGGGESLPVDCTLISAAHGFWQRRCTPPRTRVSCAIAQSFFQPVSWGFRQTSRRAHGGAFWKAERVLRSAAGSPNRKRREDSAGMTGSVQQYFITISQISVSVGRFYDVTKGTDSSPMNRLRSPCIFFFSWSNSNKKLQFHPEAKMEHFWSEDINRRLNMLFSADVELTVRYK